MDTSAHAQDALLDPRLYAAFVACIALVILALFALTSMPAHA